jgi:hypothetical protein
MADSKAAIEFKLNQVSGRNVNVPQTFNGAVSATSTVSLTGIPSGATQVAAGAAAGELWVTASHATLADNIVMMGV